MHVASVLLMRDVVDAVLVLLDHLAGLLAQADSLVGPVEALAQVCDEVLQDLRLVDTAHGGLLLAQPPAP